MTRTALVLLALTLIVSLAAAQSVDRGTGLAPAENAADVSGQISRADRSYTIGYTTDAVVTHYATMDAPQRSIGRADLIAQGHTLVPVNSLNPGDLDGLDGLIIGVVQFDYALTSAQMDVVEGFVLAGGNLWFLGENNNHFRDNNVAVGGRFGIEYPPVGGDAPETTFDLISAHVAIQGPHGAVAFIDGSNNSPGYYGSMSSPGPHGLSLVDFPGGYSACVLIEPGLLGPTAGFVIAVAEINVWDDGQIGVADNRVYWNNLFAYDPGTVAIEAKSWSNVKAMFD